MKQLEYELNYTHDDITVFVDAMLLLLLTAIEIINEITGALFLSPEPRYLVKDYESYRADLIFLRENNIHTIPDLSDSVLDTQTQIAELDNQYKKISNQIRRPKSKEEQAENKERRKAITIQKKPLRERLRRAERILEESPRLYELLQTERRLETAAKTKKRERGYER